MRAILIGLALMLIGCGDDDHFAAGTWRLEGWMESDQGSTRGKPGNIAPYTVKVTDRDASMPPVAVFFTRFYGREDFSNIRFEEGRVEGSFVQRRVDGIGGHRVPVTGTYARDRFDVEFEFTVFGGKVRQLVKGRLIGEAN